VPLETLVDGYTFFVTTGPAELGTEGGLFHRDTRYLSRLDVTVSGVDLLPVGETTDGANARTVTLATAGPTVNEMTDQRVAKHTELVVSRHQTVHEGRGYSETVSVHNHAATPLTLDVRLRFGTDFADLFEVRGLRSDIDRAVETRVGDRRVESVYGYETADGDRVERRSTVRFGDTPGALSESTATFTITVDSQSHVVLPFAVTVDGATLEPGAHPTRAPPVTLPVVAVDRADHGAVFARAAADLEALTTRTEFGPVPLAGTPWFVTPFGRDALLTAHQTLAVAPALAEGTLRYLAAHRGRTTDAAREEVPGKVFHELRNGELADRGYVPHTPYYGTVDATPLWVSLLAELCRWRGDADLARELAEPLVDALEWIRRATREVADDPFVYYRRETGVLDHKAWKDTADSIRFADGEVAAGPLAVAEVQGYAAAALDRGSALLERVDPGRLPTPADEYRARARAIEAAFDREFWLPERSVYALAKHGDGRIVDAVASNVGHCLWTGTVPEERADTVVETLVEGPLASGWGLRTMSPEDAGYSPVSYHAGSVWPHDTSIAALGLARYGHAAAAEELGRAVLDAATQFTHDRLPELFCGFGTDRDPVEYPAACTPQAWAAGAPFAFLRAAFRPEPTGESVRIRRSSSLFPDTAATALTEPWE
jgi:glycogen debranching enzyme